MSTMDGAVAPERNGKDRVVQIYPRVSQDTAAYCPLQISVDDTAKSVVNNAIITLGLDSSQKYTLLEVRRNSEEEMLLDDNDCPLMRVLLWPTEAQRWHPRGQGYHFILQQQAINGGNKGGNADDCYDLCNLQTVTEESILEALRQRFYGLKIYTYACRILIAINPNKFLPVYYNPKYVKMYENQPLGKLSPHIFAIADVAFRTMLSRQVNQCIVLSGESGSGKTESSSYLIHCLTALSQKSYSTGLERTILGAGPVLEAFGNAMTAENNNSSRFGKFIQLNYLESGVIRGAVIEKYLLERCRLVSRDKRERNYHVFYYLLVGASKDEREDFYLLKPQDYLYLKQQGFHIDDVEKFGQAYKRLQQAMEMVGFLASTKKHIFSLLSAILHLGNVTITASDDTQILEAGPPEVLSTLTDLLKVKKELLVKTLTKKRVVTANATIDSPYTLEKASKMRDSMAMSLYSTLFDWITLHINHALFNRRDMEDSVSCLSIGVLDMFGFENLRTNSFEQLCINYSNEKLQCYINQHIFRVQQEDYVSEGIAWQNIDYNDNSGCIQLISEKSTGLFDLLDGEIIPNTLSVSPQTLPQEVPEGSDITLSCNVTRVLTHPTYLSVTWLLKTATTSEEILTFGPQGGVTTGAKFARRYADGGIRLVPGKNGVFELVISRVMTSNDGTYECNGTEWTHENENGGKWIKIVESTKEMGTVKVIPTGQSLSVKTTSSSSSPLLSPGDTLTLLCSVGASNLQALALEVTWLAGDRDIITMERSGVVISNTSSSTVQGKRGEASLERTGAGEYRLSVRGVGEEDGGEYTCRVRAFIDKGGKSAGGGGRWHMAAEKKSSAVTVKVSQISE
uniref:unconventional myosin-IXb-like n=1 Tax=Solea senegalensis TaxID=28829 RepID=UPI001CD8DA59|nr:unconventional myosin-IXb-like [Solea senegalensis]